MLVGSILKLNAEAFIYSFTNLFSSYYCGVDWCLVVIHQYGSMNEFLVEFAVLMIVILKCRALRLSRSHHKGPYSQCF
jgi:apolipoprotein N-acyltransferase